MTTKVKKSSQHRGDTVSDPISSKPRYAHARTHEGGSFLASKRGQPLKLALIIWLELWKVCPDNLFGHLLQEKRRSITSSWLGFNIDAVYGKNKTKMSTPSRSRSSAMGDEGYFDWRETMERHQWKRSNKYRPCSKKQGGLRRKTMC